MEKEKSGGNIKKGNIIAICIAMAIILVCSMAAAIYGGVKLLSLDVDHEKAIIDCDDKDYSSYVKHTQRTVPGNDNINSQLETTKRAMQSAQDSNDASSFGRLWDEYNRLLQLQAQTSTTYDDYDYSEADNAKDKCYKLAEKQTESNRTISIVFIVIGSIGVVISTSALIAALVWKPKTSKS